MEFVRSASSLKPQCKLGPRTQLNLISSVLDGNFIYGSDSETADKLRAFVDGQLKSTPVFRKYGLKDLLPLKLDNPDDGCIRATPDTYCFQAGDPRVNEQLVLSVTHILLMREHNRMAAELAALNPHWSDETTYQETRHIMAALIQQITYNEFLPMVLGKDIMAKFSLILERHGYFEGYDATADPSLPASFTAAAFRFGHSLLPSTVERWSTSHKYIGAQRLSQMLRQPYDLYKVIIILVTSITRDVIEYYVLYLGWLLRPVHRRTHEPSVARNGRLHVTGGDQSLVPGLGQELGIGSGRFEHAERSRPRHPLVQCLP